ncbi:hypothetical protein J2Y60_003449 [Arcicella sp. BE140]|nr:hypothetical protein [Arcicella sp. BE51]MDR6813238.1 hypothetical protein [Arcicella sp. BE140]MDR6824552.1 hypothetical protein [Arcicella sp. BE139]
MSFLLGCDFSHILRERNWQFYLHWYQQTILVKESQIMKIYSLFETPLFYRFLGLIAHEH